MKGQRHFSQFVSFILTLALVLGMLPTTAFASGTQVLPQDSDYKGFSMEDLNNKRWISYDKYSDQETLFFAPVYLSKGQGWTKLTFTIELSQYVSLELYKITDEHLAKLEEKVGNNKQIYHVLPLAYQEAETENPTLDDLKENFLGMRMGYLHGVSIQSQVKPREDEPKDVKLEDALNIVPSGSNLAWDDILKKATAPDCPDKVTADNLYAFGFTGKKYIPPETADEGIAAVSEDEQEPSMDEAKIQNYFIWDGTVVDEDGIREDPLEDGYYVIVLTSKEEPFWQYNSFLAFQQKADNVARFDAEHYNEPKMKAHEYARTVDPVDLFTGAFTWDYTDMSLFGKHDLPFTRYYNSIDAGQNYGLGKGWSTEYTADLYLQPLFAQVSLPNGRQLNFNINYDGSYQADGDYTLAWNGSGYTLTNTHTLDTYQFDADGNIQQLVYPDGDVIRYSYTGGRLASISNGSGTFTLEYNGDGNISKVTDSVGRSVTLSYDGDQLTAVENPDGDSLRYTYDGNGYLATVSNFKGQVYVQNTYNADGQVIHQYAAEIGTFDFTYDRDNRHNTCTGTDGYLLDIRYDDQGRITESTDASGTTRFTWNDANQLTSQTDRDGNTTAYTHDAAGNISQITYPDGTVEKMEYNADRKVTKFTDRNGASSSYTYDGDGQVTSVTDSLENTTVYGYTDGFLTSMTDALGNVTSYENDALGNRTSMTDAQGNKTKYTYDSQGRLVSVEDAQGNKTAYEYTDAGKLVKITDAQGNEQTYTVDGNGFNTSESDWMGHVTTYERNTQNQVTKVTDPLNNATTYTYDERGNRVTATDANGNTTGYGYDAAGRMTSMTDAAGNTWTYSYNANGQMVSITDPAGGTTTTAYGSTGRTSSTTGANGGVTRYTYDGVGNTTKITDALGKTTVRTYDAGGNLTSVTDRNGKTTTYTYDAENRMVSSTDALGRTTTYTYDALGRMTKTTTPGGSANATEYDSLGRSTKTTDALGHATGYSYDTLGRVTKVTYADGTSVSYTYDANGQVLSVTDQLGGVTAYTYDAAGRVTKTTDPMEGVTAYTYDAMGNVLTMTDPMGFVTAYTYNSTNNIASVIDANGGVIRYAYDSVGRVASVTDAEGSTTSYSYDAGGNLVKQTDAEGGVTTYSYDKLDRQTGMTDARGNTWTYVYDNEGRLVSTKDPLKYTTSKTYDAAGQLVAETDANGNAWAYEYDADGRMTAKTDPLGNKTTYAYDKNGNLLKTTTSTGLETSSTYDKMGRVTKTTDPMGHAVTFLYDAKGQLVGTTNADGTTLSYSYDAGGNVLTATDEAGNVVRYVYDAGGRMTQKTDALGRKTAYEYDSVGNLVKQTDALGGVTSWAYDKNGNLTSTTDPNGNTTAYTYDKLGRVLTATDPNGGVVSAEYDKNGNIVKVTDAEKNVTIFAYDALNRLSSYTDAEGNTFAYTYDGNGNILTYTDGNGNVTKYTYDGLDRAISRTNAEGNAASNTYDAEGRMVKAVDEEGAVTLYAYDDCGRLTSMTDALGHVTAFEYDVMDRVTKVTDAKGNTTAYTYDVLGNVISQTNAKGVTTTYTYDANNDLTSMKDAAGTTFYTLDALGRVTAVTDRNGNTQSFTYDAGGRITKVTDKNGNETAYTYDGNGNIVKTTDALGNESVFAYNANDQLVSMDLHRVDGVNGTDEHQVTLYEYDGRNLVTKEINAAGGNTLYVYDGNGNMVSKTDADGYVTEYSYNSLDLVSHISYNGAKEVSYQYNKVGELVKMDDWLGATTFELDLLNQLKKVTDHKGNVVEYTYDEVGNQTNLTYPDKTTVLSSYDALGQLTQTTDGDGGKYTYTYDNAGNVTKLTYPNGWVEEYSYDAEGNLLKTVDTDPFHNNKKSTKYEYTYDAEGNLITEYQRDSDGEAGLAANTTYTYDALNRLTGSKKTVDWTRKTYAKAYTYDSLGNLVRENGPDSRDQTTYQYNSLNQMVARKECGYIQSITRIHDYGYTYDGRGNLVKEEEICSPTTQGPKNITIATYTYDETNKMVSGTNKDGEVSNYTFNGLGVRVGTEVIVKDNTHGYTDFHCQTPTVETGIDKPEVVLSDYVIDYTRLNIDQRVLVKSETDGYDFRYTYGLDLVNVKATGEGTNWWAQSVKKCVYSDYVHTDRLGSVVNLTDQYGRIPAQIDYDDWGKVTAYQSLNISGGYRTVLPEITYTGHQYDDVLNMYYAKARMYDAENRRFASVDPVKGRITEPMTMVQYLYVVDNPLRWVDLLGKATAQTTDGVYFRQGPGKRYNAIDLLVKGTIVSDLGTRRDSDDGYSWALVEYKGQRGWIADAYLQEVQSYFKAPSTTSGLSINGKSNLFVDKYGYNYVINYNGQTYVTNEGGYDIKLLNELNATYSNLLKDSGGYYRTINGEKTYYETIGCYQFLSIRNVANTLGISDTLSWWKDSAGKPQVLVNSNAKNAYLNIQREGNKISITVYVHPHGEYVNDEITEVDACNYVTYWDAIKAGIEERWSKYYPSSAYDDFGNYEGVILNVNVSTNDPGNSSRNYVDLTITKPTSSEESVRSFTTGGSDHNTQTKVVLSLSQRDQNNNIYHRSVGNLQYSAAHEFGHVFMIGDAYGNPAYPNNAEVPSNDLMRVQNGITSSNDVEMVWLAWLQGLRHQSFFTNDQYEKSDALRLP